VTKEQKTRGPIWKHQHRIARLLTDTVTKEPGKGAGAVSRRVGQAVQRDHAREKTSIKRGGGGGGEKGDQYIKKGKVKDTHIKRNNTMAAVPEDGRGGE